MRLRASKAMCAGVSTKKRVLASLIRRFGRLIAMEVLCEWLEKTAAAIVAVLSEEHLY